MHASFSVPSWFPSSWMSRLASTVLGVSLVASALGCSMGDPADPETESAEDGGASRSAQTPGGADASVATTGAVPCDVDAIVKAKCQSCHGASPEFGAPMPLVTLGDFHAKAPSNAAKSVFEVVGARIHDDARPMPQKPNPRLTADELKVMDTWIASGAPAGASACGTGPGGGSTKALSCTPDVHLAPPSPFAVPEDKGDLYVCYGVDVPVTQKKHVVAIAPKVDNTKVLHHIVLLQTEKAVSPTPTECSPGSLLSGRMVYAWAPGGEPLELPKEAGFPVEGTAHYMVQIHYNNAQHLANQTDTTGVDFCTTTELRPNDADVVAFGTVKFSIPAHATLDTTCEYTVPQQLHDTTMFVAMPHMHQIGRAMQTHLTPKAGGPAVDLGDQPAWDFQTQSWFPIAAKVKAGDKIATRCAWDNPGSTAVKFGENTADEMCFSFTMYYPRVTTKAWNWALPAALSKCGTDG
ncbi:MAG: peptidylglycine alpha-amidating monooxygenase [Polyangiaceae bacterium]